MLKGQKGITLVALVVTIIVLIILAGVSLSLVLGQNGIITRAKSARELQANAEAYEKAVMSNAEGFTNDLEAWINGLGN